MFPLRRSARWPTPTPAPRPPNCAGRSASPSTTTGSTTCSLCCNLALLTGKVGRYGCGSSPLRGQNNVQGGGDMGALPNKLPGFQDVTEPRASPQKFETLGRDDPSENEAWHLTQMIDAIDRGDDDVAVLHRRESGAGRRRRDAHRTRAGESSTIWWCQEIFLTKTAQMAHVVLPARRPGARATAPSPTASAAYSAFARRRSAGRRAGRHLDPARRAAQRWARITGAPTV